MSNTEGEGRPGDGGRVAVLLPLPLRGTLDYAVPPEMRVDAGAIVRVRLNQRPCLGVVWDGPCDAVAAGRLKAIDAVMPRARIDERLRRFVDWVAQYTLSPPGAVLAMVLRASAVEPDPLVAMLRRGGLTEGRLTPARQRVIEALGDQALPAAALARAAGVSAGMLRAMARDGWLAACLQAAPARRGGAQAEGALDLASDADLAPDQGRAAAVLADAVVAAASGARADRVILLQGATGSGKTEVYFEAIRSCLALGRQALVLLPEIALSAQVLRRFEQRFGAAAAVWHSDLPSKARREAWRAVAEGSARVVVGARSALFLPFADLGLMVVDEEHESSFKQEEGVIYHARDMAVVRGRLCEAAVILVSATPSLETLANVEAGRYGRVVLPGRFGGATLPLIAAVDLRAHPPPRGRFLSAPLVEAVAATLDRGEQAMLFLNRRGYAPLTLCRACGFRLQCRNCTAWLVEHRVRRVLTCHHCGHTEPVRPACPSCSAEGSLTPVGPGVERITEEVAALFPQARQLVMTSDTLAGPKAAAAAEAAVAARRVDIIIGTQIAAKGWHFPHLTLVGVVDADLGLAGGDLRAAERTVQLLHQVAGRAGRAEAAGSVLLQSYQPDHAVIRALVAGDFDGFMQVEAAQRRAGHWPPYGRLVALIVSAAGAEEADAAARALGRSAPTTPGIMVLGPAPAPLALLRGRHRRRLLLRAGKGVAVQPILRQWLDAVSVPRGVRVSVDVDPCSFL